MLILSLKIAFMLISEDPSKMQQYLVPKINTPHLSTLFIKQSFTNEVYDLKKALGITLSSRNCRNKSCAGLYRYLESLCNNHAKTRISYGKCVKHATAICDFQNEK